VCEERAPEGTQLERGEKGCCSASG
jgi:hypothetical protein